MSAVRARLRRGLRWLGGGLLALGVMLVAAYLLIAHSAFGRERVRRLLLVQLEPVLAGRVELEQIARLDLGGIELRRVRARDPSGALVLTVESLAIDFDAGALLGGEPVIARIAVRGARVDLADLSARRGLVAAFTPREPAPPSPDDGPPLALRVAAIALDDVAVRLEHAQLGTLAVEKLSARAGYRQRAGVITLALHALRAELLRADQPVATLERARGHYASAGAESWLALQLRSGRSALALAARGRVPGDPEFTRAPLRASLTLDGLDRELIARLDQPALAERWLQPLRVELSVRGSAAAPHVSFALRAAAGAVAGDVRMDADKRARFALRVDALAPAELLSGIPAGRVSLALAGEAELARAPDAIPLTVRLSDAALDGQALPTLSARAELYAEGVRALQLEGKGCGGTLALSGEATFAGAARGTLALSLPSLRELPTARAGGIGDGASFFACSPMRGTGSLALQSTFSLQRGVLAVDGSLRARALAVTGTSLRALDATFAANGALATPRLKVQLRLRDLRHGDLALRDAAFDLAGGPDRYTLTLQAHASQGTLSAELGAQREPNAWGVELAARGALRGTPFALQLKRARIGDDGTLGVSGLEANALGQRVTAQGKADARRAGELQLNAAGIDLAALSSALGLQPRLQGRAALQLRAHGRLQAPVVELSVRGEQLAIERGPRHELELDAALDAVAGRASVDARVRSGESLSARLAASAEFPAGTRPGWPERMRGARFDGELELERITTRFVQAWALAAAAMDATAEPAEAWWPARLSGRVHASGTVQEPALDGELHARIRDRAHKRTLELALRPRYAAGAGELALSASDPDGPWLDAELRFSHPEGTTAALLRDAARLPHEAAFEARAALAPRRIALLPGLPEIPAEQRAIAVGAQLTVAHAPRSEPSAELSVRAEQPARPGVRASCQGEQTTLALNAKLNARRLEAQLVLAREQAPLVTLRARSTLALEPVLAQQGLPAFGDVALDGRIAEVELASLPFLCKRVSGRLAGTLRGERLLTDAPRLQLALQAKQLSIHPPFALDATLAAQIGARESTIDLALQHGGTRSHLQARVPLLISGKQVQLPDDQPFSARLVLDRLPAGALAPPGAPVSRLAGTLSGQLELAGTRNQPLLRGRLELVDVGFTATALAQPLSDLDGAIVFAPGRISIERMTARDGDGTLQLDGNAKIGRDGGLTLAMKVNADEFPLRQQGRIAGDLDASAKIDATLSEQRNQVAVRLEDVSIWLRGGETRRGIDLAPHPDIADPRRAALPVAEEPAEKSETPLELVLDARDSFWVRRDDFAVKMSLQLSARSDARGVVIKGPVVLHRGYLTLLGRNFAIAEKSRLDFVGDSPPDPVLAIEATAENRRSSQTVTVQISGRTSAPQLQFSVDGKPQSAADAALALFSDPNASEETAESQVQSFAGGLTSGILGVSLRRELGGMVPILVIEPASSTSTARVRAGFELDAIVPKFMRNVIRGVYVEGMFASGSEEQDQNAEGGVLLELYLPADLVTSGQYGPGQTWSLDLGWEP